MYLMKWNMGRIIAPSILNADPKHVIGQLHDPATLPPRDRNRVCYGADMDVWTN
jgi:hypothetical protein